VDGKELGNYRPESFYSEDQIQHYIKDIFEGRRTFTEEVADEGLDPEILRLAEESYGGGAQKSNRPRPFLHLLKKIPKKKKTGSKGAPSGLSRMPRGRD
jgi:hypothetical protein